MEKKYFKVGDLVTCSLNGKGFVTIEDYNRISVRFECGIQRSYDLEGRCLDYTKRTLHQGHIDIPEPELKEIVTFEKGEIVWCMDNSAKWHCVKFEEFNSDVPKRILASHPQSDPIYCSKEYYDIRKYEDRPF